MKTPFRGVLCLEEGPLDPLFCLYFYRYGRIELWMLLYRLT